MNSKFKKISTLIVLIAIFVFMFSFSSHKDEEKKSPNTLVSNTLETTPPTSIQTDSIEFDISIPELISLEDSSKQEMLYASVKQYDIDRMKKFGPTSQQLSQMTNTQALEYFFTRPFMTVVIYHDDNFTGTERLLRASEVLNDLIKHDEFPSGILELLQQDILDPNEIESPSDFLNNQLWDVYPHLKTISPETQKDAIFGILTTHYAERNILLTHPTILSELKGNELNIIKELANQHKKMLKVNENDSEKVHSVNIFLNFKLATALLNQHKQIPNSTTDIIENSNISESEISEFYEETIKHFN